MKGGYYDDYYTDDESSEYGSDDAVPPVCCVPQVECDGSAPSYGSDDYRGRKTEEEPVYGMLCWMLEIDFWF